MLYKEKRERALGKEKESKALIKDVKATGVLRDVISQDDSLVRPVKRLTGDEGYMGYYHLNSGGFLWVSIGIHTLARQNGTMSPIELIQPMWPASVFICHQIQHSNLTNNPMGSKDRSPFICKTKKLKWSTRMVAPVSCLSKGEHLHVPGIQTVSGLCYSPVATTGVQPP